ncbi:unnamed protein product [Diatraea saccharalis]|uniref:Uncharacterized protein n=1 Tax=Diatraea saccharalis TaxID=40085 RepID=A0A9N9WHM1_9NEOP|nr:unnamed protein product [Diatraea saccharalis]
MVNLKEIRDKTQEVEGTVNRINENTNEIKEKIDLAHENMDIAITNQNDIYKILGTCNETIKKIKEKTEETKDEIKKTIKESKKEGDQGERMDTYANITIGRKHQKIETVHSLTVSSENKMDTSEEVLQRTSKILEAEKGKVRIDKVRKSKDQKIVIACNKKEDIDNIEKKLRNAQGMTVEQMKNKDPLVVLKNTIYKMTDEEALEMIIKQNDVIFGKEEEKEIKIKFMKKARDTERCHIVLQVKPTIWNKMTKRGHLYIGMERVRVENQSPLIQCTRCLQFGHGRKFCTQSADRCSHCGGLHLRADCPDRGIEGNHRGAATARTQNRTIQAITHSVMNVAPGRNGNIWLSPLQHTYEGTQNTEYTQTTQHKKAKRTTHTHKHTSKYTQKKIQNSYTKRNHITKINIFEMMNKDMMGNLQTNKNKHKTSHDEIYHEIKEGMTKYITIK